jgi:hypothetical protein
MGGAKYGLGNPNVDGFFLVCGSVCAFIQMLYALGHMYSYIGPGM